MRMRHTACLLVLALLLCAPAPARQEAQGLQHFLLLGFDYWGDETIGVSYTDTNILASIDKTNGRLLITSLLRDTYVQKPDGSWGRLNNIARDDGFDVMLQTVSDNYGVQVDTYLAIGVKGMRRMIDAVGGVEITLTRAEAEKLSYVSGIRGAGTYNLNSSGAMAYMRLRKIAGHDFGRTERQRKVLAQLFAKLQDMTLAEATQLGMTLFEEVKTNISLQTLMEAIAYVFSLRDAPLEMMYLPVDDGYENVERHGMAVYELDWEKNRQALADFLYNPVESPDVPPAQ